MQTSCNAGKTIVIVLTLFIGKYSSPALAQDFQGMMQQNMQQQQALQAQMEASMRQSEMQMQHAMREYINQNRPALEQERQAYMQSTGATMSLEEYTHAKIMAEAARRNAAANPQPYSNPIFEQQKRNFQAGQQAYQARQQNFDQRNQAWAQGQQQIDNNNQAWMQGQRQIDSNNNRFVQQAIQGNQYYKNTETGEVAELPFAGSPGVYQNGEGSTWTSGTMGQFNQVGPQGMPQQMEEYEPEYYDE
ncbi:MAG: hypothetical protein J0M12_03915 [Deltaproteobacteria bacterium]|nr:hypothetical protein [Deltaproteobacteria bacterium]